MRVSLNLRRRATLLPANIASKVATQHRGKADKMQSRTRSGWLVMRLAGMLAVMFWAMLNPAHSSVLDESAIAGGFSNNHAAPTPVPGGITLVRGSTTANVHDFLVFEGLEPGAQTLTITFRRATSGAAAGGEVYFKQTPFNFAWDGTQAGTYTVNNGNPVRSVEISLPSSFAGGRLHVGLYQTHGPRVFYEIDAPRNVVLPPPPTGSGTMFPPDAPGGAYSTQFGAPTPVAPGYEAVEGVGRVGQHLFFVFNDLPAGAQTIIFEFTYPDGALPIYWAGGEVMVSERPFRWQWDGRSAGTFAISPFRQTSTLTLTTGASFGGTLHVGLFFTYGFGGINFRINVPSNATAPGLPDVQAGKHVRVVDQHGQGCAAIGSAGATGPQAAIPGACLEYVIEARNGGNGAATEIAIDDLLDANMIFIAAEHRGFDGPSGAADFRRPAGNTDCATGACRISLRNGHLAPGTRGQIIIRGLLK